MQWLSERCSWQAARWPSENAPASDAVVVRYWNGILAPLVFLDSVDHYTLPVGIALFRTSYYSA